MIRRMRVALARAREALGLARYVWWARWNIPRGIDPRYQGRRAPRKA
jgi:hypothetical protein